MGTYRIREVDTCDNAVVEELLRMHDPDFLVPERPLTQLLPEHGWFWICHFEDAPIGFISACSAFPEMQQRGGAYFRRVYVEPRHRRNGLMLRMMNVMLQRVRREGFPYIVSDTSDNLPSANVFVRAGGWRMFKPSKPWTPWPETIYWKRSLP